MKTQASSSPSSRVGNNATSPITSPGRKPRTGIDWSTSSTGNMSFSARALRAMSVPQISVKASETPYAATPRHRL